MADARLRHAIAFEAARLMYERTETEYFNAKRKAARIICRGNVKPSDLPKNAEIRDLILHLATLHEGESRQDRLRDMRFHALQMMHLLRLFKPRLIGSVLTGHIRKGSDIDLHLFSDSVEAITAILEDQCLPYEVERKEIRKNNETRIFTHIHVRDRFPVELTVYAEDLCHFVFKSSITGKAIERVSIRELEEFLSKEYEGVDVQDELENQAHEVDRFLLFQMLLQSLENVKQNPKYHPEGDVLYHSQQVFELARRERPWDEEFLLAALLHDVGKGIDPGDHVNAGLEALDGLITERTAWLIAHHMDALAIKDGSLGIKARKRLEEHDDFEDLMLLRECDTNGRIPGRPVDSLENMLNCLRQLEQELGG
ncbi:MAG: HD domain-containing protein [Zavarzinella sp.]